MVREVRVSQRRVSIVGSKKNHEIDCRGVKDDEWAHALEVLEKMNFDGSFVLKTG